MRSSTQAQQQPHDGITVTIARFGSGTREVTVPVDTTVADALAAADLSPENGEVVMVAGVTAQPTDIVEDGDIVSIVTPKGGA